MKLNLCSVIHNALSSKHALIYVEDAEKHFICDLKSTNGTKVNDELIANNAFHPLNDGDTVSFGGYEVIYFKLADGIGGVLDRSADDIQTTATQATENNDTNPLDDSFEFPASTSFMNTEEESSLKNNSEASFNLMLEETYNSDTMLINCSDKETTKLVVDEPEKYSECPEPVKEQEIQHDLSSETIEKSKPNDPPDEADADTLLVNEDVFSEKEKNQTAIENLCTQVCDDHVSNIYAGVPQQSVGVTDETMNLSNVYAGVPQQLDGLMDETMIVGQEDSKEKET
ncbi:hypothetical protein LSTR_LSTR008903 [Laodelphax striatellus]|uniref:FHA domain-containing protein n=1 Tax=Laodelphax striatellus TaxID=195883 RepID=A0A482WLG6_LAOST|nr:hypothetical protein LSTR_LSTR008903 [Laodelphax striatellus]